MRRNLLRNLLFIVGTLLLVGASLIAMQVVVRANQDQRVILSGHTVPLLQHAQLLHATNQNQPLNLTVGLKFRNQGELDVLLSAMYNPQSPQYHHYLTPAQFNQLFAPTADQVQQVTNFLKAQGFTVTSVASNNLLIDATGTVAQAEKAFNTQINTYQLGTHTFYAQTTPPSIPLSISQFVTSIGGLDNSVQYHPLSHRLPNAGSGYAPKDLTGAYDAQALQNAGNLGDNQTIAVFELDGYNASDITQYTQQYNLGKPNITNVMVDGFNGAAGQGAIEVELDIEIVAAMAPHANQIVYEGPNTTQGLNDTYNKIVTDNKAQITTISWGLCESSTGSAELQTLDGIYKQGAAQGIAFFAAAGDSGAYDCNDSNLAVDSPAGDPYITGVGGTNLQLNNGSYGSESIWANPSDTQRSPNGAGGGGGISSFFTQPSWQTGPGVKNQYSTGKREVPDVSADADPATGYAVYCTATASGCPTTGWVTVGGTSAAAPLWAGSTALINQYLQSQGKARIGFANPALYALFNAQQTYPAFHDVTSGTNLFYPATTGYDQASGIGSPDIYNIARDLATLGSGGNPTPTPGPSPTPSPTPGPSPTPSPTPGPSPTPSPTPSPVPSPSPTPSSGSLIVNGTFEAGQVPWQESSSGGYQLVDPTNPHNGLYSAYFCGYIGCDDRLSQSFTVPSSFTKITLTYWWYSDTNKTSNSCLDTFVSRLMTGSGTTIRTLQQSCQTNATNGWVQQTYNITADLSAYKGKQVILFFRGTNVANQFATSDFFVDDVVVTVQ